MAQRLGLAQLIQITSHLEQQTMENQSSTKSSGLSSFVTQSRIPQVAGEKLQQAGQHFVAEPAQDLFSVLKDYAHKKPDVAAMWCFGLGLIIGWKLRR